MAKRQNKSHAEDKKSTKQVCEIANYLKTSQKIERYRKRCKIAKPPQKDNRKQ